MSSDFFSKLSVPDEPSKAIHPIDIFQGARIRDTNINDLWLAQGDALREWHSLREQGDLAIVLNTGAGKTLVGLLIAQSLVNETQRQVVYACSSIQLVQQTADKAEGYGLPVTTYYQQQFSTDNLYQRSEAPCITTYQALFNGRSRFRRDDIAAVVFDDAHTVDNILREQFSLHIVRTEMPELYNQLVDLYRQYHHAIDRATSYDDVCKGVSDREFFVPPFEVLNSVSELRRLLREGNLRDQSRTRFSWEHLQDHEDLCCVLISRESVTLTPAVVPTFTLPYFGENVRRIYLSATLTAPDSFVRVFGREPDKLIAPSTTAGECERMIVIPSLVENIGDDIVSAKEIIREEKALILVPSFASGEAWSDVAAPPSRENVPEEVNSFREAPPPEKLTLAARYDGIDLPGDTCRMMVLDGLPTGSGPLERFQRDGLNLDNSLRSMLASRIVQSFGRISRGMSDHGVVVITGNDLMNWLELPRNRSLLPEFLQKQIRIGQTVSEGASGTEELEAISKFD